MTSNSKAFNNESDLHFHNQLIEDIKAFMEVLNEEYQAILNHQIDKMKELSEQKESFLDKLQQQQASVQKFFKEFPDQKESILKLSQEFEKINNRNGMLIQGYLNQLNRVLNIVYGKEEVCYKR